MDTKKISIVSLIFLFFIPVIVLAYDYEDALEKALIFFDANKCGPDAGSGNYFSWRGACHTSDGNDVGHDLTGGYHDAGDHVKFGMPQCWTAATLGWAYYEFKQAFDNAGATSRLLSVLNFFGDYFLRSHTSSNTFYYNVGDGNADHGYWGKPEDQTGSRPCLSAPPGADICGQCAAALALMYLNTNNNSYLNSAKQIYSMGSNNVGDGQEYRCSDGAGGSMYSSSSHYDDLCWGGIWLSIATGDDSYLDPVDAWLDKPNDHNDDNYAKEWSPAWDDVTVFVLVKMFELTGMTKYYDGVINNLEWYRDDCQKTPAGLPWLDSWGVLRYASAEAGTGYIAAKLFQYAGYLETADFTMDYILGDNPRNRSYITGWGSNPPVHPHHRANEPVKGGSTNGIVGALVGGPGSSDEYSDDIDNYERNEVAIDYNASLILGLAGRIYFDYNERPKENRIPRISITSPSGGENFNQGEAITITANASDDDGEVVLVEFFVNGSKVGEDDSDPYSIEWSTGLAGNYNITGKVIDDRNGMLTSPEVNINVIKDTQLPDCDNKALDMPVSVSSIEDNNNDLAGEKAVDGSTGSRWSSEFSDPQWIRVDLQSTYIINRVILRWEASYGKDYEIQVSDDGNNWTTVSSIVGSDGSEDDIVFAETQARYVRLYGTKRGTDYGYSLYEFEICAGDMVPISQKHDVASKFRPFTVNSVPGLKKLSLEISLKEAAPINVKVFSLYGNCIAQLNTKGTAGMNRFIIPENSGNNRSLTAGVYIVDVRAGDKKYREKVVMRW